MKMGTTCWSGGRAGRLELDIPSASTRTSSTLSDSTNSQLAIRTTKPRTPRKRPNQTYNEAASLLSTVFSAKLLTKPLRFAKPLDSFWDPSPPDLFLPFPVIDHKPYEIDSQASSNSEPYEEDFDSEWFLDEEIEEGIIDRIMGISRTAGGDGDGEIPQFNSWLGLGFGFGVRRGVRPLRQVDDDNRSSPIVDVLQISPRFNKSPVEEISIAKARSDGKPLLLKLDNESVVNAWSDRGSQCDVPVGPSVRRKPKSKKIASLLKPSTK